MRLKVRKVCPEAKLPVRATPGSACYDVSSTKRLLISPNEMVKIPTGLVFELPKGFGLDIRPRSGLASKGLIILNSPGTLDSDYRGELLVSCKNISDRNMLVEKGGRIAQIRLFRTIDIQFEEKEELNGTRRGEGGFGSTDG